MFDQTFVNTHARTRKPWTVAASLGLQTALVAVVLILPLLHPEVLHPRFEVPVRVSVQPLSQPPEPAVKAIQRPARTLPHPAFTQPFAVPARVPQHLDMVNDTPLADLALAALGSTVGMSPIAGVNPALPERPLPQPVLKPDPIRPAGPLRVGNGVQSAKLIFGPKPHFSPIAIAARIEGTVRIQALIATDGTIRNLQMMSGPPLLAGLALDAVKQWRYQPTLLNGSPVEVVTEIDVVFTLGR